MALLKHSHEHYITDIILKYTASTFPRQPRIASLPLYENSQILTELLADFLRVVSTIRKSDALTSRCFRLVAAR
jgi:hypothetical protein